MESCLQIRLGEWEVKNRGIETMLVRSVIVLIALIFFPFYVLGKVTDILHPLN
jgi:hypothetical protein